MHVAKASSLCSYWPHNISPHVMYAPAMPMQGVADQLHARQTDHYQDKQTTTIYYTAAFGVARADTRIPQHSRAPPVAKMLSRTLTANAPGVKASDLDPDLDLTLSIIPKP